MTLLGVDGLYWDRGALVGVQNGVTPPRVARFCLDARGRAVRALEVLDRNPAADEPTLGAVVGDSVFYVATSQWEKFGDDGKRVPGSLLRPATVLGLNAGRCHSDSERSGESQSSRQRASVDTDDR